MEIHLVFILNTMWTLIAAILVFIMHAGFSLVEVVLHTLRMHKKVLYNN